MPKLEVKKGTLEDIRSLRLLYLQELNAQSRYHACHERGWSDTYLFLEDQFPVGYASVKGLEELSDRDTVFEIYILPPFRKASKAFFDLLQDQVRASFMESQSNDGFTTSLLYQNCNGIQSDVFLFGAGNISSLELPEAIVRKTTKTDKVFGKNPKDWGAYVLEINGAIVADGGFLLHYNPPFADLYMETAQEHRNKGYASFLLQELQVLCYHAGRIPAARCNINNPASKAALLKSGMKQVGHMLHGKIKKSL